ncbi:AaceriACR220Cp [[Ashbya] aceris (nom. inval.)]|nr:AaceriACR220Cp [[Ashbya] aceris (nom. inval.)]
MGRRDDSLTSGLRELKIGSGSHIVKDAAGSALPGAERRGGEHMRSIKDVGDQGLDVPSMVKRALSDSRRRSRLRAANSGDASTCSASPQEQDSPRSSAAPATPATSALETVYQEAESSDDEWQPMPAIASYDVYDERGELAVTRLPDSAADISGMESAVSLDSSVRGKDCGAFGYTKAAGEEQAQRAYATNKKTDFLFKKTAAGSSMGSAIAEDGSIDDERDSTPVGIRSADEQLVLTKTLLNDRAKFAYLGAVTVLANQTCTNLAELCLCSKNVTSSKKLANRLHVLQKNMGVWQNTICQRLYSHLGVSTEEIEMIQKLPMHGIRLQDLCKCLKTSQVIENPWMKCGDNITMPDEVKKNQTLEIDVSWTIICDLFLLLVQDSVYDSRSRTLLMRFAEVLDISRSDICEFEKRVVDTLDLEQSTDEQVWIEKEHMHGRRKENRKKKMAYVGLATIGGSLVLGLSGGLLAPVIGASLAAGLSTIGVSGAAGFLTGVGGTTLVAVSSTAIGANVGRKAMNKRMGSVKTFEFRPLHNNRRLNLIVSVSGWMIGKEDDVRLPFSPVDPIEGDLYSLHWEPDMLKSTGQTITILASEIVTQTIQQILGATVLTALMAAIQVPNLLSKLGYIIDNPWNVSLDRAWAAGLILADTLMAQNLGARPISLVGFSLGSRVIYSCLLELSKRGAIGLVEDVYLFGSPLVYNRDEMVMARAVVSGRFVNGYSDKDWILGYLFRATAGGLKTVAGISPIEGIEGIENMNCTDLVEGHMAYRKNIPSLLKTLGVAVLSEEFTEIDDSPDPEQVKRERKLIHDLQDVQEKLSNKKDKKQKGTWVSKWFKPKREQWQDMYEDNLRNNAANATVNTGVALNAEAEQSCKTTTDDASPIVDTDALVEELQYLKEVVDKEMTNYKDVNDLMKDVAEHAHRGLHRTDVVLSDDEYGNEENVTYAFADDI